MHLERGSVCRELPSRDVQAATGLSLELGSVWWVAFPHFRSLASSQHCLSYINGAPLLIQWQSPFLLSFNAFR